MALSSKPSNKVGIRRNMKAFCLTLTVKISIQTPHLVHASIHACNHVLGISYASFVCERLLCNLAQRFTQTTRLNCKRYEEACPSTCCICHTTQLIWITAGVRCLTQGYTTCYYTHIFDTVTAGLSTAASTVDIQQRYRPLYSKYCHGKNALHNTSVKAHSMSGL
jgi:hypothetical protein